VVIFWFGDWSRRCRDRPAFAVKKQRNLTQRARSSLDPLLLRSGSTPPTCLVVWHLDFSDYFSPSRAAARSSLAEPKARQSKARQLGELSCTAVLHNSASLLRRVTRGDAPGTCRAGESFSAPFLRVHVHEMHGGAKRMFAALAPRSDATCACSCCVLARRR